METVHYIFSNADIIGIPAKSGVPDQPCGKKQTMEGANNRANFGIINLNNI